MWETIFTVILVVGAILVGGWILGAVSSFVFQKLLETLED